MTSDQPGILKGVKGDRVEIVVDTGGGVSTYEITATKAGRRVEINTTRNLTEVVEVTRSGTPVRTARFITSRVIALVEHPAGSSDGSAPG
jgi:hypothetical protein